MADWKEVYRLKWKCFGNWLEGGMVLHPLNGNAVLCGDTIVNVNHDGNCLESRSVDSPDVVDTAVHLRAELDNQHVWMCGEPGIVVAIAPSLCALCTSSDLRTEYYRFDRHFRNAVEIQCLTVDPITKRVYVLVKDNPRMFVIGPQDYYETVQMPCSPGCVAQSESYLAVGGLHGDVVVYDKRTMEILMNKSSQKHAILSIGITDEFCISGGDGNELVRWKFHTAEVTC
eukprot:TRINITY_DN7038_c0_g1_i3.p1 TRINITY_DN7038_c0_g1~~TRINITY_DN7038_c0_g1_i3.p1  ORF type:complete len:253 (+),score=32.23 TRINITY_DN7038_c0_g1_i3:73-759(+)